MSHPEAPHIVALRAVASKAAMALLPDRENIVLRQAQLDADNAVDEACDVVDKRLHKRRLKDHAQKLALRTKQTGDSK